MMYDQDTFEEMVRDFITDHRPEYDDLEIDEILVDKDTNKWVAFAQDEKCIYEISDNGFGELVLNYLGTR